MKISTLLISCLMAFNFLTSHAQSQVTVCDGTDYSAYVPFFGFANMDGDQTSQMIYPASLLSNLEGKNIKSMVFYPKDVIDWTTDNTWAMAKVDMVSFSSKSLVSATTSEIAKTVGEFDKEAMTWTITFDNPFAYTGGNLLIQGVMPKGYNGNKTFFGARQDAVSCVVNYNNMGFGYETSGEKFLPKVTFICEDAEVEVKLGDVVLDEPFESYTDAFSTSAVGDWTYIDKDGWSTYVNPNMGALPHAGEAQAYQLIDTGDSRYTAYYRAHGGKKFLMSMSAKDGIVNNDWLISPALNLKYGGKLTLWAMGATGYASFQVLASTTDTSIESFTQIGDTYTKLGGSWNQYSVELPKGTKYFAIRNVTDCGGWLAIPFSVDDISVNEYVPVPTAINNATTGTLNDQTTKRPNDQIYNLNGQRLSPRGGVGGDFKGVIISNGRKYIAK